MPSAMTYDLLVADIQSYCERSDVPFVDQIPRFIALTEARLAIESKPLGFVRVVTGALGGNTIAKPSRWRRTKSFSIMVNGERQYLQQREYEYCRTYAPDATVLDTPVYFADYDFEHFFIAPTPNATYDFELSYWEMPEPLSETQQTNWTTQYLPQALLYGALMEAMPFLKTSERIPEFQALFDRALGSLVAEDQGRQLDNTAVRSL